MMTMSRRSVIRASVGVAGGGGMQYYGWSNTLWSCIAAYVTFATPYAIFVFQQYSVSIPMEIDESARIDGASPWQIY